MLTGTWIPLDVSYAVMLDVTPQGYTIVHRHHGTSTEQRGGGLAVIHRKQIKMTTVNLREHSEFKSLAVKLVDDRSTSVVVCVYTLQGSVTSIFTDQLSDLLDQIIQPRHRW